MTFEEFREARFSDNTFALFGDPVAHSVSPSLHHALFQTYGFPGAFVAVEVAPSRLQEAFALARGKLRGICCTIPHKETVLALCDEVEPEAGEIGAVNAVCFTDGKAIGYNTDGVGFLGALARLDYTLRGKRMLLAGYGGAAAVIAHVAKAQGASVTVTGRDSVKGKHFADKHGGRFVKTNQIQQKFDLLVNGTPVGMGTLEGSMPVPAGVLKNCKFVFDAIYNPLQSALLSEANRGKARTENGLAMLVLQGAAAQTLWTGHPFAEAELRRVLKEMEGKVARKRLQEVWGKGNLVLIGFMGCGKTTIARQLARQLSMKFVDIDKVIEREQGLKIAEIFQKDGESAFRRIEAETIARAAEESGCVIATGGGAVEQEENVIRLRETGVVIYLSISPSAALYRLRNDVKRPLLQSGDRYSKVNTLLRARGPLYQKACHFSVNAGGGMDAVRRKILKNL